ncbi:hypothetical protein PAESOLCIP111_04897 [Paenibacillus solanacearum]|uniref:Uncharacterized protein n=1 Tax=Paenibacillus solanacearum TaxID=2048548 RepID=A0A916K8E5_9BACL|nr:hypothetical protein PAESOLCIP111_04897 [Paenibacillus solanacearum]
MTEQGCFAAKAGWAGSHSFRLDLVARRQAKTGFQGRTTAGKKAIFRSENGKKKGRLK